MDWDPAAEAFRVRLEPIREEARGRITVDTRDCTAAFTGTSDGLRPDLRAGRILAAETEGFGYISVCVSYCSASRLYRFRHPLFLFRNVDKKFISIHTAFQPQWLDRGEFDPIRGDPRFLACSERVQRMAAIAPAEPF